MIEATRVDNVLAFGPYSVDAKQRLLLCDGHVVSLEPKVVETLVALVEARGRLMSKDELLQRVWPDTFVEEGSLARNISTLRKVLGEGADTAKYIETIPKRGYRFVAAVRTVSQADAVAHETNAEGRPAPPRAFGVWWFVAALAGGVVLASSRGLWRGRDDGRSGPPAMTLTNPVHVTTALGVEEYPAWSPDGRTLAFSANSSGNPRGFRWDIWVTQAAGGTPVNRTSDYGGQNQFPSWSPDGTQIAFWSDRDGGGCFVMNALAGAPRRVAGASPLDPNPPQWSADGTTLACVAGTGDTLAIDFVSLETGELVKRLSIPGDGRRSYVSQSGDGRALAFAASPAGLAADVNQLWVMQTKTGKTSPVTNGWTRVGSASWSPDGRTLYYVSNLRGSMDLWQQAIDEAGAPEGSPQALTAGVMMRNAAFTRDGSKVAYSQGSRVANVWRVPILSDRPATWADAEQITFDQAYIEFVDVSPDGCWLAINSNRSGNHNLWVLPAGGGEMRRLTTDATLEWGPRWSRDGLRLAFYAYRSSNRDLWTMPAAGGPWTQVTTNPGPDLGPSWSPDGAEIVHLSVVDGVAGLWVTPAAGGHSRLVAPAPNLSADWAPSGALIAFTSQGHLFIASATGNVPPRLLPTGPVWTPRWSPDGSRIYVVGTAEREGSFFAIPLDGSGEHVVTRLEGRRGAPGPNGLATDGWYLYFTWDEDLGDVWVMNVERGRRN